MTERTEARSVQATRERVSDAAKAPEHAEAPSRPAWLQEPCPRWCDRRHRQDDLPDDRWHWATDGYSRTELHLEDMSPSYDGGAEPCVATTALRQRWRGSAPEISVDKDDQTCLTMTVVEAAELAAQLERLVSLTRTSEGAA